MAIIQNTKTLDLSDIQGMLTRGYSHHNYSAYLMLKVGDELKGKQWIKEILPQISTGDHHIKQDRTLHLAFGPNGLLAIGMHPENVNNFPNTFLEGQVAPHRSRSLGDTGDNAPENWRWGAKNEIEVLLILHARTEEDLQLFLKEQRTAASNFDFTVQYETTGFLRSDNKEPFGFHDGISQPVIKGSGKKGPEIDFVETGEFILGYKNEHGHYPSSPEIMKDQGDLSLLKPSPRHDQKKDLGINGSFMVFREMQQHVDRFWNSMEKKTLNEDGSVNEAEKVKLAAKCVGRWPSGASLVMYPDADPGGEHDEDDFGYAETDPDGLKCPFGSHLRRNNPRDTMRSYGPKQSLKISRRHRIVRRGRTYEIKDEQGNLQETGTHFICFNTNIELQFEFIQYLWANNNQASHLTNDPDILIGVMDEENPNQAERQFTIQAKPVNKFIGDWETFVNIKGGAYFFFPSISAINYLTTI